MTILFEHSYRLKGWKMGLGLLFCAGLAGGIGYVAAVNDAGLRLFRLITLDRDWATAVLWALAAAPGVGALGLLRLLAIGAHRQDLTLRVTDTDVTGPVGWMERRVVTVPLEQLGKVEMRVVNGVHFLTLQTPEGKIAVNRGDIGKDRYEALKAALAEALG